MTDATTSTHRTNRDEPERVSSGAWVMKYMKEIGPQPDQPRPSFFYDSDWEDMDDQSLERFRVNSLGQDGASVSANDAGIERVRLAPMGGVEEQFPLVDIDQEQSWESPCRESSLFAARASTAGLPHREMDLATAAAVSDDEETPRKRNAPSSESVKRRKRAPAKPPSRRAASSEAENANVDVLYIRKQDIRDDDVLKGRGGRTNHHVGNKRFRKIIADMKEMYQKMSKTDKTALSRGIVEYVHAKGGRFLIENPKGQVGWRIMTKEESRKKTSQALREPKDFKWTLSASGSPSQGPTREG